ncbi:MAG: hypothetical protein AAGA23_18265 [Pseudomonadota bacterium]
MSDCTYQEGATFDALSAAMADYASLMEDAGSKAAIFHWYPIYGAGGESFDFKWVESYASLVDQTKDLDRITNDRLFVKRNQLLSHLITCDSRRVYMAESVRHVQLRK